MRIPQHFHNFHHCTFIQARYLYVHMMTTKNIAIGIIVVLILAIGGYLVYSKQSKSVAQVLSPTATSSTQVQGQDVKVGTGKEAKPGSIVSVLYVGKFTDGKVFDSSAAHNNQPLTFQLGAQGLIPGFQIGVNGMKVGGERLLAVPPALGYGAQDVKDQAGKTIIPANSTLVFDVQLIKVEDATSTPSTR